MKMKFFALILMTTFTFDAFAESLRLFDPVPGATLYEVVIVKEGETKGKKMTMKNPVMDTDRLEQGNYIMRARFQNVRGKWSDWTDKATLKIVKKMRSNSRDLFDDKYPFGGSVGMASLTTKLAAKGVSFESDEAVLRGKGFIQRNEYKLAIGYDKSTNLARFDIAVLKQINPNAAIGVDFWMVNFDARNTTEESEGLINFTQSFFEFDYMHPFWDRWFIGVKSGIGFGISYFARPELTYSIPFGDSFYASASLIYEITRVVQSDFVFNSYGMGGLININYFLEI